MTSESGKTTKIKIRDILFAPIGCLLQITNPFVFIIVAAGVLIFVALAFPGTLTDLFSGMTGKAPHFLRNYQIIQYGDENDPYWEIIYQYNQESTFSGKVRHISLINSIHFPMLSHDILVTSGDFSNPDLVTTSVANHHFRWTTNLNSRPAGTINLLHVVPASEDIEIQLNRIKKNNNVIISGLEISRISKIVNGLETTYWHDSGCNSILVTYVEILDP